MYLRFGDIPSDEKSRVWKGGELSGEENGVSVYDVVIGEDGKISVGFPLPATKSTLDTFIGFIKYQNRPMFLVDGDFVGRGSDNEPLIKNVKIIKEIRICTTIRENR